MPLPSAYYGTTLTEADEHFTHRLHERAWSAATSAQKAQALIAATRAIDALNFKGSKAPVYALLLATPNASQEDIRIAEASQDLEFPRDADTEVPEAIRMATYEVAYALLDGKEPEADIENLSVVSSGFGSARIGYNREQAPLEHIANGIPSFHAWTLLRPFLRDSHTVSLIRVS